MATAFRASAQVVNSTAGTSVVVPRPTGTADGDALVAFIARTGTTTVSAVPAGWTLISDVTGSGNGVRLSAYWKVASGEPASWTWTLSGSQRNWGVVAAYTGADPTNPIAVFGTDTTLDTSTVLKPSTVTLPDGGQGIAAGAAVRTASGTATTWTHSSTERNDVSTNAGSGTDICGVVGDSANPLAGNASYGPTLTASQSQTGGAAISVSLNPLFVLPGDKLGVVVEAAFGADPDSDLSTVDWTDISASVRPLVRIRKGVLNENGQSDPTRIDFEVNNPVGDFTPDNPASIHWPNIQLDTPIRVSLSNVGVRTYERGVAFVDTWAPSWNDGPDWSVVTVSCGGRLQRLQEGKPPIKSPAYRKIAGNDPPPLDYWSLEDGPEAASAANAVSGGKPAAVSNGTFGGETTLLGSTGVLALGAGGKVIGTVRRYTATGQWWVTVSLKLPVAVTATTTLVEMFTSGTARRWRLVLVPGFPDQFRVRAYDSSETQILDNGFPLSGNVSESDVYGQWVMVSLGVTQNGANIDYDAFIDTPTEASGVSATLNANTHGNLSWASVTATAELDGMGVANLAAIVDPTFDTFSDPRPIATVVLDGNSGESAWARFIRLCQEERVPLLTETASLSIWDVNGDSMGPQLPGSFVGVLRDVEARSAGILHDGGPLGKLILSHRSFRYNKAVGMSLTGSQLMKDFQPRFDTQARKGEVTASRPNGASYVFSSGAPGLQDSIQANVESDSQLPSIASWRSAKGQAKGMRYPSFGIDLRAHPELAKDWLKSGISTRVNLNIGLPQHPTTTVDLFIDGYAEELDSTRWVVNPINCSPARPQGEVFELESTAGNRGRLDTAGSVLAAAVGVGGVLNSNPYFETTASPWTAVGGTVARSTAQAHEGVSSLLLTPDGVTSAARAMAEQVTVTAGQQVLGSAWVNCAVSRGVDVNINWFTSGGSFISSATASSSVTAGTWKLITLTATAPATTGKAAVQVSMTGTPPANNLLWIDEARLEPSTPLLVATTTGPVWTTDTAFTPMDLDLGGEQVRAARITDGVTDTFNRTESNGWGSTPDGLPYSTTNGSASDFSVAPNTARIANNSVGILRAVSLNVGSPFVEFGWDLQFPIASASGGAYSRWLCANWAGTGDHCGALVQLGTDGVVLLAAFTRIGNVFANLGLVSAGSNAAGNFWRSTVKRTVGGLQVTVRNLSTGGPVSQVTVDLPAAAISALTDTHIAVMDRREVGNTDVVTGQWDALVVSNPQAFTVLRGMSGFSKAHSAGDSVSLWQPPVWAL